MFKILSTFVWRISGAALLLVAGSLHAQAVPSLDEMAREALSKQQYQVAADLSKRALQEDPSSAINWYRLALASQRLSNKAQAQEAISRAKEIDPSLKFASQPSRVEALERAIASLSEEVDPTATAIPKKEPDPVLDAALRAELVAVSSSLATVNAKLDALKLDKGAAQQHELWFYVLWIVGAVCGGFLLGYLVDGIRRAISHFAGLKSDFARSSRPLQNVLEDLRDDSARLVQRLELHGHASTELYLTVKRLLPALEREAGRSRVNVASSTMGKALEDIRKPLQPKPAVLGETPASTIHQTVAKRIVAQKLG